MIPFPKEPDYDPDIYDVMGEKAHNPNLYITMADYISNRIWSPNITPWQETLPWQLP